MVARLVMMTGARDARASALLRFEPSPMNTGTITALEKYIIDMSFLIGRNPRILRREALID